MTAAVLLVVAGYVLGTLPTAVVVAGRRGHDPTREGSGNPGATNVYRTAGRRAGALVLVGDLAKGAVAAGTGWLAGDHLLGLVCGTAAVVGHVFPLTRRFRGGKGVATAGGATLVLFPVAALVAVVTFAAVAKLTGRASLGSLTIAVLIPVLTALGGAPGTEVLLLVALAAVVVARHASNIVRLVRGTEPSLGANP